MPLPNNPVSIAGSKALPYCGFVTATTVGQAITALDSALAGATLGIQELILQNDPASGINIAVGNATAQTIILTPGQYLTLPIAIPAVVYVKSASSTVRVNILGRN